MNQIRPSPHKSSIVRSFGILLFITLYLGTQLWLIAGAYSREHEDKRFGFWMFPESTHFRAVLVRELRNEKMVRTNNGAWIVFTEQGPQKIEWRHFVRDFRLQNLEATKRAKTGIGVTLKYLQHALDYVAARIPEDKDTRRLWLIVEYQRAGGKPEERRMVSHDRFAAEASEKK